jgi:hypothetical protein
VQCLEPGDDGVARLRRELLISDRPDQRFVGFAGGLRIVKTWTDKLDQCGPVAVELAKKGDGCRSARRSS